MRALVFEGPWRIALQDRPEPPSPTGHQVLVRIHATGICGTDLGIISGQYHARVPVVLGHESAGEVVAVGPQVASVAPGTRVAIDPTFYCGCCRMCRTGRSNHCERKTQTETGVSCDGTLAPYFLTEERFVYPIEPHVPYREAALTEPLSCVLTGTQRLRLQAGLRCLVIGAGPIGLLYASVLGLQGLAGGILERSESRRALAGSVLGPAWWTAPTLIDAKLAASAETFDVVVETSGQMADAALPLLERGGQLLLVGLRPGRASYDPGLVADRSVSIIGSIDSLGTFADAATLIANRAIAASRIVSHVFGMHSMPEALALLGCDLERKALTASASALKIVINPQMESSAGQ